MVVALATRRFEAVGHFLAANHSQRGIRPHLAGLLQLRQPRAHLVERRAFPQIAPRRHQPERRHALSLGFPGRFPHLVRLQQGVPR